MKCLKNELAKMIRKQIKQLQNRRERLKVSEEKLKSAEDKTALLKASGKLRRQIANAEKTLEVMKNLDVTSKAAEMFAEVERRVHNRKREEGKVSKETYSEEQKPILEKLEYLEEVRNVRDTVQYQLKEKLKTKRRLEKAGKRKEEEKSTEKKKEVTKKSREKKEPQLGKRALKRQTRAEEWRRKQAERLQSESKSFRKARSRVAESVFLVSLSDSAPIQQTKKRKSDFVREEQSYNNSRAMKKKKTKNSDERTMMKKKEEKKKEEKLHPSWVAKKKQKETIVSFQGTRVTFDD